ncbi:MAG: DJ-1/PfpI family protein, partial [Planctomycetota bacterium]|nr:DJ-1/PfpI family protein [Planctomycetota bacterium]
GLTVQADITLAELRPIPDAVILPGGMPGSENLGASAEVAKLVKEVHARGGICAAICAAPAYALAAFGVLQGKRATCYPGCESRFPPGVQRAPERVVVDGNIVTSQAPGTALEFALALAEILAGKAKADALRAGMLVAP